MKSLLPFPVVTLSIGLFASVAFADSSTAVPSLVLKTNAAVTGAGVYLTQVLGRDDGVQIPHVRFAEAPAWGESLVVSREQVGAALEKFAPHLATTNWSGAAGVLVSRKSRVIGEMEMAALLTEKLQQDHVSGGGELELRFTRSWGEAVIPDEPFEIKILSLPVQGVSPSFLLRFELRNETESFGVWQDAVRASLWKDVWVATSRLRRGQVLLESDVTSERRDVLMTRNLFDEAAPDFGNLELKDNINPGLPLYRWSVRERPVVRRGDVVDAMIKNGGLSVALKVQVQEDGVPGQTIRIRNPLTKRELLGKVQDDQSIQIEL